jgi:DNA-binding MarR family transcriptional regulator
MASDRETLLRELSATAQQNQRASEAVNEAANALLGINATDGRCLAILDGGGRMTAGQLAREAGLTTGGLTAVLDRLERAGYAQRLSDPTDRRRVLVEITDRARELSWELFGPLAQASGPLLDGYTDEQLATLADFHRIAAGMQERHAAWLRERAAAGQAGAAQADAEGAAVAAGAAGAAQADAASAPEGEAQSSVT